jgi:hypothetical protein
MPNLMRFPKKQLNIGKPGETLRIVFKASSLANSDGDGGGEQADEAAVDDDGRKAKRGGKRRKDGGGGNDGDGDRDGGGGRQRGKASHSKNGRSTRADAGGSNYPGNGKRRGGNKGKGEWSTGGSGSGSGNGAERLASVEIMCLGEKVAAVIAAPKSVDSGGCQALPCLGTWVAGWQFPPPLRVLAKPLDITTRSQTFPARV